ncbi:alpha-ribazole phosphatase [Seonamhaeicola sp. MEBiC1930]|uniref:alpha-ribazole phosphatase n=1 Tax=Seonamhaeicola sp. MEBiC01930 TaxID=2976768 RepID=UPI00324486FD
MEIYLVRHTTPKIEKGICYGQADLDLTHTWKTEFKEVKTKLPSSNDIKIISSPLRRCALLAQNLGKDLTLDDRLKELNFGDWELKEWNFIPEKEINPWMKDFVNVQTPNGESYTQLASRVFSLAEEVIASKEFKKVIIVSHAGPIRAILAKILNIPLKNSFKIKIEYGDVFFITKEDNQLKLITDINL